MTSDEEGRETSTTGVSVSLVPDYRDKVESNNNIDLWPCCLSQDQ